MTEFAVTDECRQLGLRACARRLEGLTVGAASDVLRAAIAHFANQLREQFESVAEIRGLPEVAQAMEIVRAVGVKPRRMPPSSLKMLEFAWRRGTLPEINSLVDAYNLVSLQTRCSLGAHDLSQLQLPVELRRFSGSETFTPLGATDPQPVVAGEFGYVDGANRVICRLDSLQAEFSKVTESTSHVLLIVETSTVHSEGELEQIADQAVAAIEQNCR